jgi:hypothetical protein
LFREISLVDNRPTIGLFPPKQKQRVPLLTAYEMDKQELSVDDVRRVLETLPRSVFVVDEFDRAAKENIQGVY